MTHTFKKGQRVTVLNQTMGGTFIIEGLAKIVRPVADVDEQYLVRFESDGGTCERFVDPAAQENPAEFVSRLNDPTNAD